MNGQQAVLLPTHCSDGYAIEDGFLFAVRAELNSMRFTSVFGLACSLYALALVMVRSLTHAPEAHMRYAPTMGLWNALPTINVAYSLHYNGMSQIDRDLG